AYTDTLTGLANRLSFRETLDQRLFEASGAARQLALLFADIDDFKRVNDTIGHDAGDEVLMQFAARMRDVLDRHVGKDTVLARFGGDEFVILLEAPEDGTGMRDAAAELAAALVEELGRPIMVYGRHVFLGISIGITLSPDDASNASALMKNGDIAMYQAKVAGKNCYRFYSRAMDQAVERRVHMEQDLRGAWERGELSLVYQPVFRLSDGKLAGAEALLRWHHPQHRGQGVRSEEHTSELQSRENLVCRLLLEKKKATKSPTPPRVQPLHCNATAPTRLYTLSLHDALPICGACTWSRTCAVPGSVASSAWSTSPCSVSRTGSSPAPRRCCAGTIRSTGVKV